MHRRYEIRHPLEGGPGVSVYLVSDQWEKEALKVMTLMPPDSRREAVKIEQVYSLRTALDHPLLIRVHDLSLRGRRVGFITDYLDDSISGGSVWAGSGLADRQAIALQLADLLAYLHARGFHCGYLSPAKLFRLKTGHLLANIPVPKAQVIPATHSHSFRYASPEIIREGTADRRSDLYSLGMLLYHMFTDVQPFAEDEPETVKLKQFLAYPIDPRKVNPDIPPSIERLILDLIQKDPHRRPEQAEYVCAVLEEGIDKLSRPALRLRSALVGREPELDYFRTLVDEHVRAPKPRFLAIGGPGGIGKSRLLEQFEIIGKIRGIETCTVRHHPDGGSFQVLQRILVPCDEKRFETVSECSGNSREDSTEGGVLNRAISQFLEVHGAVQFVLVDNLQCMDEGSSRVYSALMSSSAPAIVLVATHRSDQESAEWSWLKSELIKTATLTELSLAPLTDIESEILCRNLLGYPPSPGLLSSLVPGSSGNPFYLCEHVRYLQESGRLSLSEGHWVCRPMLYPC